MVGNERLELTFVKTDVGTGGRSWLLLPAHHEACRSKLSTDQTWTFQLKVCTSEAKIEASPFTFKNSAAKN